VRDGKDRIELRLLDGVWWLTQPHMAHADPAHVERVLDLLTRKSQTSYATSEVNLESAFLLPPGLVVTFNESETFGFGTTDPLRGLRYILHKERVYLVEDLFIHILGGEYTQFVNRLVIPDSVQLEMIETPSYTLYLENEEWKSDPDMAPSERLELYSTWRTMFSREIVPYQAREGAKPVVLTAPNPRVSVPLEAFSDGNTLYIGRPDIQVEYHLPGRFGTELRLE
jgi:hypothetical protein